MYPTGSQPMTENRCHQPRFASLKYTKRALAARNTPQFPTGGARRKRGKEGKKREERERERKGRIFM